VSHVCGQALWEIWSGRSSETGGAWWARIDSVIFSIVPGVRPGIRQKATRPVKSRRGSTSCSRTFSKN